MMRSIGALIGAAPAASFSLSVPTDSLESVQRTRRQHAAIVDALRHCDPQAAERDDRPHRPRLVELPRHERIDHRDGPMRRFDGT